VNPLSIGNFFHEDLAYLAALEATGNLTPEVEQKRNAWWKLLLWHLNDDLKVIEQPLKGQPFLNWIPRQGGRGDGAPVFDRISWLKREGKIVGVVSPVLLVRPLPDERLALAPWDGAAPMTERVRGRLADHQRSRRRSRGDHFRGRRCTDLVQFSRSVHVDIYPDFDSNGRRLIPDPSLCPVRISSPSRKGHGGSRQPRVHTEVFQVPDAQRTSAF